MSKDSEIEITRNNLDADPSSRGNFRFKRVPYSQMLAFKKNNISPQTYVIITSGDPRVSLLYSPNSRSSNLSGNGIGYGNQIDSDHQNGNYNSHLHSDAHLTAAANLSLLSELLPAFNDLVNMVSAIINIDFTSLNNSIYSLAEKGVEGVCKLAEAVLPTLRVLSTSH